MSRTDAKLIPGSSTDAPAVGVATPGQSVPGQSSRPGPLPGQGAAAHLRRRVFQQAGAVPFRVLADGTVQVMLITNRDGGWIVPKGMIDRGHTPEQTAQTECMEEAGVLGQLGPGVIGTYEYDKGQKRCRVRLFALRVSEEMERWPEGRWRRRQWLSQLEAVERASIPAVRAIIERLRVA
jgi:8-oxo-dGTP pyrophosphatase MutT (NUDIX family)